jgi:hypothetical protein
MFPHERSLVARLKDAPFALVGVNSDKNFADLKKKEYVDEKITWRSFTNGPEGTGGPIAKSWKVEGWPTLYLINGEGQILKKWLGSPGDEVLDGAIDAAVAGLKPAAAPAKKKAEPHSPR